MVAGLRNVHADLAQAVADGLGLARLPKALPTARKPLDDLGPSAALSIIDNGPKSFAGRKLGILATDGADATLLTAMRREAKNTGVVVELVTPAIAGITDSGGTLQSGEQKIGGGPSVLYDAVAILTSDAAMPELLRTPAAKEFLADAFAHCKYIAYEPSARPLLEAVGIADAMDDGCIELSSARAASSFFEQCAALRFWQREDSLNL